MRKFILSGFMAAAFLAGTIWAEDEVIKVRPPAIKVEHRSARPGPNYVWVGGYQRWDGHGYVWEPGRWEVPPHEHAVWVAPRWEHRNGGYVFVAGRWK